MRTMMIALSAVIPLVLPCDQLWSQLPDCATGQPVTQIPPYSGDTASFQVDLLGNILVRPNKPVDENDIVVVYVNALQSQVREIRVRRTSALRPVGMGNIIGGDDAVKSLDRVLDSAADPQCLMTFSLSDFAPGRGEVALALVGIDRDQLRLREVTTGIFDFRVNPVYIGGFSLGPARTRLENPSFDLLVVGEDSLVTVSDEGARLLYVLYYTPFVWGRRDLEKVDRNLLAHINPVFGVSLSGISENAFLGISVDLPPGIFLHYGWHFGRIRMIDPASGLMIGGTASGLSSVPTVTSWDSNTFLAASIDLRAALKFFQTASSTVIPR
jgi:hypothetical protein